LLYRREQLLQIPKRIEELGKKIIEQIGKDKFTPLGRLRKLRQFEEADRVTGSFAFWSPSTVGVNDISVREYHNDPEKMYYCQLQALDRFGHDYPMLSADIYNTEPEALGARIEFPENDTPMIVEPAIKKRGDLCRLAVPDPFKDGRLPYRIEICRIHKEVLGEFFPTVTSINAPFSMAVGMRGYGALVTDMLEDPDFVHRLLEFCTQVIITFGKAIHSVCGSYPSLADAWSSIPNLSHEMFLEYSFPYAARCIEVFEHSGWNFGGGHQFFGDYRQSLRRILASGTKTFTLFEENITGIRGGKTFDLREIKEICKNRGVFLYTAIHPDTIRKGPSSEIESRMENWINEVASGGGQGFYTSVLSGTKFEYIEAFVKTIRKSIFPIS
jgi:uroporphyrinogen-III decarboxylase